MKLSRRMFLRTAPAAPLAAPALASEMMGGPLGVPPTAGLYATPSTSCTGDVDPSWMQTQRTRLEQVIAGKFDERDEMSLKDNGWRTCAYHYDGMRSMSPVARAHFHARAMEKKERERRMLWAQFELKDLLANWMKR